MRGLRATEYELDTPLEPTTGVRLAGEVVIVAILRAGLGMVDGFLRLVPDARVGHLGMYRDEEALRPVGYYENIPPGVAEASVFVVDPMLATGGSAVQAVGRLKRAGARDVSFICLVAAPEGIQALHAAHPDVPITTATLDRELDEQRLHPPRPRRRRRPHLRHRLTRRRVRSAEQGQGAFRRFSIRWGGWIRASHARHALVHVGRGARRRVARRRAGAGLRPVPDHTRLPRPGPGASAGHRTPERGLDRGLRRLPHGGRRRV